MEAWPGRAAPVVSILVAALASCKVISLLAPGAEADLVGEPVASRFRLGELSVEDGLGRLLRPTSEAVSILVFGKFSKIV